MKWISVKDRMPKSNQYVLFCYKYETGITRVSSGSWIEKHTVEPLGDQWEEDLDCVDDDRCYLQEGWREWGWELEFSATPDEEVTHWMPMPKHPDYKPKPADPHTLTRQERCVCSNPAPHFCPPCLGEPGFYACEPDKFPLR